MYIAKLQKSEEIINKELEKYQNQLNQIAFVKQHFPNSLVKSSGKNLHFYDDSVLKSPNLKFKVSRQHFNVSISFHVELKNQDKIINIHPSLSSSNKNKYYRAECRNEIRIVNEKYNYDYRNNTPKYSLDLDYDSEFFFKDCRKKINDKVFDQINETIYNKIRDILRLEKIPPTENLLKVYPDLNKYVVLF